MSELTQIQKDFRSAIAHLPAAVKVVTTACPHDRVEVHEKRDNLVYFKRQFHRLSATPEFVA
jgi:flavin reductase (DIM6/NTAB) family NADH-FMN oxidoreductase RutF